MVAGNRFRDSSTVGHCRWCLPLSCPQHPRVQMAVAVGDGDLPLETRHCELHPTGSLAPRLMMCPFSWGPVVGPRVRSFANSDAPQTIPRPHDSNRPQCGANRPSPGAVAQKSSSKRASSSSKEWSRRCPSANNVINCNLLVALLSSIATPQIPCSDSNSWRSTGM